MGVAPFVFDLLVCEHCFLLWVSSPLRYLYDNIFWEVCQDGMFPFSMFLRVVEGAAPCRYRRKPEQILRTSHARPYKNHFHKEKP
jgi:hypothetical protein